MSTGTYQDGKQYDVVFAGGGTAACIAAGRIASANPDLSVLIIEGGKNNLNDPTITNPALFLSHLAPDSQTALFYKANKEKALNDREAIVPSGGVLGGGSSINFMMYTRAQGRDFDSFKTEGWDAKSIMPIANKLETYHPNNPSIDQSVHGHDGPIHVTYGDYMPKKPLDDFLTAGESIGWSEIADLQDWKSCGGFSRWAKYIGPDGKRQDTAHRYVHPVMESQKCPNLHLLVESKVKRVIFEGKRATGVEFEPTNTFQPAVGLSKRLPGTVKAKKLVVVSCGALGSPSVLERSGIGRADLLKGLDIPVVADLPGVGENYQDHHLVLYPYKSNLKPEESLDDLLSGRLSFEAAAKEKNPILGWNGIDVSSKLRPTEAEIDEMGPDFRKLWDRDFKDEPDKPLMLIAAVSAFLGDHSILNEDKDGVSQYVTVGTYTAYPYSRGDIHIVSKDAQTPASFNTGFLSHPADLTKKVWAYKKQRELYRRTNAYAGELAIGHPQFPPGSKAALCDKHPVPGGYKTLEDRKNLPFLQYDEKDDAAIEEFVRNNLNTTWHSLGTCKMAPKEQGGVVDKDLNVHGLEGIKVAGEKAAEIIAKDLGLQTSRPARQSML